MANKTENMRLIMDWQRKHFMLGSQYKNALAKKSTEVVQAELDKLSKEYEDVTFRIENKGSQIIDHNKKFTFKKGV
ncbi:hypothetical protein ACVRXQ_11965 [Streptococcus panodentis]|uniref:Phage protein n=1 Tax=Streptococcus panodentis TaxID=1581472 RepID=A0ABS5AX53_9STRE|nr:hypothetical protein [Streptococcus panodentis]MBP2621152.1 hypothetical protein [Streptococcus panodentis]